MSDITLYDEGDALTIRAAQRFSVWPASPKPAVDSPEAKPLEIGLKFRCDVDGELRAVRFYKAPKNIGPRMVSVWDATGWLIAQTPSLNETASGWQQVNLPQPVRIVAGKNYTVSYHLPAGNFSTTVDVFKAGAVRSGVLVAIAGVFNYGTDIVHPVSTSAFQSYGVDIVFSTGVRAPPPTLPAAVLNPGKLISKGASGQVLYGFNQHAWGWNKAHYDSVGGKIMRIGGAGIARFNSFGSYPGPAFTQANQNFNWTLQQCVDAAVRDGFKVILCITNPDYASMNFDAFAALCTDVAKANLANVDSVIIEPGNEPNFNLYGGEKYATMLLQCSAAIRAVSPKFKIGGPTINASYVATAVNFANKMMATPGIEQAFDVGTFHPYYHTPEDCYASDLNAFIQRIDTVAVARGRTDLEYAADEVGFSNSIAWMVSSGIDPTKENRAGLGNTFVQNEEVAADYYSRLIPIMRSTAKLRYVTFYALSDEGSRADPTGLNVQAHFGVTYEGSRLPKPAGVVCKDMLAHVHRATESSMFQREGVGDGNWYARLDVPGSQALMAWSLTGPRDDLVAVNAPQGCTLSINVAGAQPTNLTLTAGLSFVPVKLGPRAIIISADMPVDFPEFLTA